MSRCSRPGFGSPRRGCLATSPELSERSCVEGPLAGGREGRRWRERRRRHPRRPSQAARERPPRCCSHRDIAVLTGPTRRRSSTTMFRHARSRRLHAAAPRAASYAASPRGEVDVHAHPAHQSLRRMGEPAADRAPSAPADHAPAPGRAAGRRVRVDEASTPTRWSGCAHRFVTRHQAEARSRPQPCRGVHHSAPGSRG